MVRNIILLTLLLFVVGPLMAQTTGSLQGKVSDESTGETVPYANVILQKDGDMIQGTTTDFDGNYNFSNVSAGTYDVEVSFVGLPTLKTEGVVIKVGQTVRHDIEFPEEAANVLEDEVIVVAYRIPLIEQDNTTGGQTIGAEDIENMATRNINSIAASTAGVNQQDEGEASSSQGSRTTNNDVYIDGVRVVGSFSIPETEIEQVQVITSGVPAEFGDAVGSITNIITKGPSKKFTGGVQLETSQYLDNFGANRADLYFAGPIISRPMVSPEGDTLKTDDGKARKRTVLGYRLAGTINTTLDSRPSALGSFQLTDDALQNVLDNPLTATSSGGRVLTTDFLTADDLVATDIRPNARNSYGIVNAKLDFKPNQDFYFVLGGQMQYAWGKSAGTTNRLLNYQFNPDANSSTWRTFGRFRHTVSSTIPNDDMAGEGDEPKLAPVFQNFSYELQLDYTQTDAFSEDPRYRDRLFEYGYVGEIRRSLTPFIGAIDTNYILNSAGDTVGADVVTGHLGNTITYGGFTADETVNAGLASYNDLLSDDDVLTMEELEIVNGRFTGNRSSVFGLFNNAHANGSSYGKSNSNQIRGNLKANFDLVTNQKSGNPIRHSIQMGGVYEQRIERSYNISPFSLWTLADQSANTHLEFSTDISRPTGETYYDPFTQRYYDTYDPLIRQDEDGNFVQMTQFGEEVRKIDGLSQYDWVNVHELNPSDLSISMFEPTTLIQGRSQLLSYYGYDYLGNPLGSNVAFNDFFNATDANGRKTRPIAPNAPIYVAGYLQDKFTYKDIIVRAGVRFDSYDANTKVLKDPYSVAGYYTTSEFEASEYTAPKATDYVRPGNIGDDYVVYVNENSTDASIVGYRNGEDWYNADGLQVNTPNVLGSNIVPALRGFSSGQNDPQGDDYDPDLAFEDYKPTLVVMPRISFSFPISREANFYANYDVLAQRPPSATLATPLTYYNFRENATSTTNPYLNNPNLRSQRTINYEVGFQQKVNDFSKVKLSLIYREERDLIQVRQYIQAYPISYESFGNDDFSTYKAFKLEYDMRTLEKVNPNLRILANYTLSFAEGTGSSPTSSAGLAAEELKYVFPLNFDQRHAFFLNLDYSYGEGRQYNGPKIYSKKDSTGKAFDILENTGLNLTFNLLSGLPYTRRQIPGGIGTSFGSRITEGSINGARMPWNFRIDLKFSRDFVIGKKSENPMYLNVYLRVQNILNSQNTLGVYSATGSPTDDGFLTMANSPGLDLLNSFADSYELLYNLRMNNPFNISRPRRIFLGARLSF